jgi:heme exporter protein A
VFQDLSFTLDGGTALVVTGANGIGKSSLLRTLAGLVPLTGGEIRVEEGETDRLPQEHAHYFGHQNAVKQALTVLENLAFWQSFTSAVRDTRFSGKSMTPLQALELLGVAHTAHLPAGFLSAGQTRRLALARLLVTPRPLWLMDEPTSALDKASEAQLLGLMNGHLEASGLIVTATHSELALTNTKVLHLQAADLAASPDKDDAA